MKRFAIAMTLLKSIPGGNNIVTRLNIFEAANIEEAVGLAITEAKELNPEHSIFNIAKLEVFDNGQD